MKKSKFIDTYVHFLLSKISLFVEIGEQEIKHDRMHSDPPNEGFWIVAFDKQKLERMDHNQYELNLKKYVFITFTLIKSMKFR